MTKFKVSLSEYYFLFAAGYYSRLLDNRLLLLILNTNLYSRSNRAVVDSDSDPAGQFAWMREQLSTARKNGHMVNIEKELFWAACLWGPQSASLRVSSFIGVDVRPNP